MMVASSACDDFCIFGEIISMAFSHLSQRPVEMMFSATYGSQLFVVSLDFEVSSGSRSGISTLDYLEGVELVLYNSG